MGDYGKGGVRTKRIEWMGGGTLELSGEAQRMKSKQLRPFILDDLEAPWVLPRNLSSPVRGFTAMEDAREFYGWDPPRPKDDSKPCRVALFVTVGSLHGWQTCGDGPFCSQQ